MFLALGLFAVAAVVGAIMAVRVFAGNAPPWILSGLHLLFGASGLVAFYLAIMAGASTLVWVGLGILVVTALGGAFLGFHHVTGRAHPKPVVILHAVLAVTGVSILAAGAFGLA